MAWCVLSAKQLTGWRQTLSTAGIQSAWSLDHKTMLCRPSNQLSHWNLRLHLTPPLSKQLSHWTARSLPFESFCSFKWQSKAVCCFDQIWHALILIPFWPLHNLSKLTDSAVRNYDRILPCVIFNPILANAVLVRADKLCRW